MENTIKNKKTKIDFYRDFDRLFQDLINTLNVYEKSPILQNYYFEQFCTLIYANLINNFFTNLTRENIKDLNLPSKKIKSIKKEFAELQKNVRKTKSLSSENTLIEENYSKFKSDLEKRYPDFLKLITEIEKVIPVKELKKYLNIKRKEIKKTGNPKVSLNDIAITKYLELYVNTHHKLPTGKDLEKSQNQRSIFYRYYAGVKV